MAEKTQGYPGKGKKSLRGLTGESDTGTETTTDVDIEFVVMEQEELERPYRVIIHNDNVTTFEFVIAVLVNIFGLPVNRAVDITYEAHTRGNAYVATLPLEEAKSKVFKAQYAARQQGFPLTFTIEPE
ncbi:MAG: ATP-dependent Clp protease adaptor ClpS [Anaerolineae bacterium]|nr:ATP-dependent Clp protease adaptor ClpS [Anaerolineae bacterium]